VGTGAEGIPNTITDQSTNLGIVLVSRDNVYSASFHRNSIAYTVVTNPDDADWLLPILQSWQFTN
jgi:hypothetical protein